MHPCYYYYRFCDSLTNPPSPELCGLTTPIHSIAAMAASTADPPRCRIDTPAAEQTLLPVATAPWGGTYKKHDQINIRSQC